MLNYKLQNNVTELGANFGLGRDDDAYLRDISGPKMFYPSAPHTEADSNEEIFNRKKAWAELEREQDEVRSNIKSLMRKAPESNELDNPLLADRIAPKEPHSGYRVPQDVVLEKKHKQQMDSFQRADEKESLTAVTQKRHSEPAAKGGAVEQ